MVYVELNKDGTGFLVRNAYNVRHVVKSLGGKWLEKEKAWFLPFYADVFKLSKHEQVETSLEAMRLIRRIEHLKSLHLAEDAEVKYPEGLDPYQRVGVRFLADAGKAILGDDVGLGKTAQAIRAAMEVEAKRVLVITKKSLIYNWVREINKWVVSTPVALLSPPSIFVPTTQNTLDYSAGWWVTNYETVIKRPFEMRAFKPDVLIVDEATAIKNRKAQRTKTIWALAKTVKYVFLLTATPMQNSPDEIWSLLHCLYPEQFSSYWQFVERYLDWGYNFFGGREIYGVKNPAEFTEMLAPIMLRRDKSLLKLPPISYETIYVDLSDEQHRIYKDIRYRFLTVLDEERIVTAPSVLAQITRLRQVVCSPALIGGKDSSAKTEALIELLEDLTPNHKVLVFTTFADYVKLLLPKLEPFGVVSITGDTSTEARAKAVEKFNEDSKTRVFIGTIQAAGEGLNLQAADVVIFLNKSWVPAENEIQAIGRAHRRGQTKPVHVINIVAARTIDEYIEEVLQQKLSTTDVVNHIAERLKNENGRSERVANS